MSGLPYAHVRILEKSKTLTGRLAGLLFADQGAEVFVGREPGYEPNEHDEYLDRNKVAVPSEALSDTSSADVIIVDGTADVDRLPAQIVLRVTAALPGDEAYGHLPADCSEDLLNALVGFYTDLGTTSRLLGRPVIYTPLPLCSVYAGVDGAIATAAALVDRERCGSGREVLASRLAGGVSAIGALALTSEGLPDHLAPGTIGGVPEGMTPEEFKRMIAEASAEPLKQRRLENRLIPMASFYATSDDHLVMPLCAPNRRTTRRMLQLLGVWDQALEAGMVDEDPYDPENDQYRGRNLGDGFGLSFAMNTKLADLLEPVFAQKTAAAWEEQLNGAGIPCIRSQTWDDWKSDADARTAGVFADVKGHDLLQLGRPSWVASAQPYPGLEAVQHLDGLPARATALPPATGEVAQRPLEGFTLVDLANVIAGPSCGRMFAELGATVYSIDPLNPQHSPLIMTTWVGELGAGKRSIIMDINAEEGREIFNKMLSEADMFMNNGLDGAFARLGVDRASLEQINPRIIGIQLSAYKGEKRGPRDDWPGYDPIAQAVAGIMERFGPERCPTPHGVASCVDYLCGYLGAWAGVTALFGRQQRGDGTGDFAETSLVQAGSLTQLLLQQSSEPASARGAFATGQNEGERVYQLSDGWIFAQGDRDLSDELSSQSVDAALASLQAQNVPAVRVQTVKELADRHRETPTTTVAFELRDSDGWKTECFAPSWFAYDGERVASPGAPSRLGADAAAVLSDFGYSEEDVDRLRSAAVVGPTEWVPAK